MKFICSKSQECDDKACPHRQSHDDCGHMCERVDGAKCVMDVAALPRYKETGTVAMFFKWREVT